MAEDTRIIKTGLFGKKNRDILDSVIGQWSDGIWENTPQMAKYWEFANVDMPNGEVVLKIDTRNHNGHYYNGFAGLDDAKVKEIFGRYVKAIVKTELDDGLQGDWKRDCTSECDYLTRDDNEPITVKDAYYAYEVLKGRNVSKHPEYSEAFYAQKDDKDYQIEIELEDGLNAEDPEKLTVVVDGKEETVDVPKDGTEDHYRKAIDAGLKKLGYKMMEGKIPDANEGKYPKFVQIKTMDDYNKLFVPTYGGDILKKGYQFSDLENAWWEIAPEEEGKIQPKDRLKSMRQIISSEFEPKFIYVYSNTLNTESAGAYISEMGAEPSDYGVKEDDLYESKAGEAAKKNEDSDGWEGWEDITDLEDAIDDIEQLAYELRSCVRGAYTGCNTWGELSEYIKGLANNLEAAGDNTSWKNDESKQK